MKMLIGGKDHSSDSSQIIKVINPYNGQEIDSVPTASKKDVESAIANARAGFVAWSAVPLNKRISIIIKFTELIRAKKQELLKLMIEESGKCISNADGEIDEAIIIFEMYCEKARNLGGEVLPYNTEDRCTNDLLMVVREPLGVVACITPFNFPVELFAHKVAPTLITGNAVILKPSSETPLTSIFMAKLMLEAGVEPNAIQIITGRGSEVGNWLSEAEGVNAVSLTGSLAAGTKVMANCAKNISRCTLELGGNDPLVVLENCDLDAAVDAAIGGRCWNAGQTCNACKRFIISNKIIREFTDKLIEGLKATKLGDPFDPETIYGTLINEKAAQVVLEQVQYTVEQGAVLAYNGGMVTSTIMAPIVLTNVTRDMDIAKDMEVFGPVWPIIGFDTIDEAIDIANQSCFGLSSGVFAKDTKEAFKVAFSMDTGACVINGNGCYRVGHEPYGGHKKSGLGVEGISKTLEEYTQLKTIVLPKILA